MIKLNPKILHLYRALLRETSYLPDPASRDYLGRYIPKAFRQSYEIQDLAKSLQEKRIRSVTKSHEGLLRTVSLANAGRIHHLSKILSLTYGRTGRRRHELLEDLRQSEKPAFATDYLPAPPTSGPQPSRKSRPPTPLPTKVMAIAKSQMNTHDDLFPFTNIKKVKPWLPETNTWGRPLPKCRERNIIRANDKIILSRLMPPLPEQEWKKLGELAKGEQAWKGPMTRRVRGTRSSSTNEESPDDYATTIEKWVAKDVGESFETSSRTMRNLWTKIWAQCPLVTESPNLDQSWRVNWGRIQKGAVLQTPPSEEEFQLLFGGMDTVGKRIRPRREPRAWLNFDRRLGL